MCQEFNNIIKKYKEIKKLNYVESINNDFNGIGLILVIYSGREDRIRTSRVLRLS